MIHKSQFIKINLKHFYRIPIDKNKISKIKMLQTSRPLKPELYYEMQKCLPLPNAINILKNLSSREIVGYNAPKILRNVRRLKTSLEEYIRSNTLPVYNDEDDDADYDMENNRMWINNDIEWKPEFDSLLRYGDWMTSIRPFEMDSGHFTVIGIPENFIGELLLHMANSSSTKLMLQSVKMNFENVKFPTFLEQLFDKKENQIGNRTLFEPVELKAEDGRIFHIFEWEFRDMKYPSGAREYILVLFVINQMDKSWFKIAIKFDDSMKFIRQLEFSRWNMQNDIIEFLANDGYQEFKQNGNKLEAEWELYCHPNLDLFIRRGANFTQFRHFEVKGPGKIGRHKQMVYPYYLNTEEYHCYYADFLVNYVSKTKYPEDFLESIDINFAYDRIDDMIIDEIAAICYNDIPEPKRKFIFPEGGKVIDFGKDKFLIVPATIIDFYNFQFTLANGPTNGAYEFDIDVHFEWPCGYQEKIGGIEIRKRKVLGIIELHLENDKLKEEISKLKEENEALKANKSQNVNIVELKCSGQIELGKKRKESSNDGKEEDVPTCSSKIPKK